MSILRTHKFDPFWMYLTGSFIVILFNILGQFPLMALLIEQHGDSMQIKKPLEMLRSIDKNTQLFLLLIPFFVSFLGLWFVVNKIHQRSLNSIATSRINLDWKRICYSFFLWSTVTIVIIFMDYSFNPENFQWNFKPKQFLIMLLIALSLIPIQTSLEEFIFRGYLMQGFGSLFKNTWAPLILTSVIFGVLHIFNPEVEKLGYNIMFYYIGTGLFLGIMTLMDDGIELSLGFHAANNLITVILVTANWTAFQTESLFISISEPDLGSEIITSLFILYPLFLFIMAKKYNWSNWMKRLVHSF